MSETLLKLRSHWCASWAPLTDQTSTPPFSVRAAKYRWLFSNTTFFATWFKTIAWENWKFDSFQKVRTLVSSEEWRIAICLSSDFLQLVSLRFIPESIWMIGRFWYENSWIICHLVTFLFYSFSYWILAQTMTLCPDANKNLSSLTNLTRLSAPTYSQGECTNYFNSNSESAVCFSQILRFSTIILLLSNRVSSRVSKVTRLFPFEEKSRDFTVTSGFCP